MYACPSVCLSVCLSTRICQKPHVQISPNFLYMSPAAVDLITYIQWLKHSRAMCSRAWRTWVAGVCTSAWACPLGSRVRRTPAHINKRMNLRPWLCPRVMTVQLCLCTSGNLVDMFNAIAAAWPKLVILAY